MNIKPLGDRVIVKQDAAEQTTSFGLVLTAASQEKPQRGIVLAVGPGKLDANGNLVKPGVAEGDHVLYSKYGGTEISYEGEEVLILRGDDILAILG